MRGWVGWSDSKKVGSTPKLIFCAKFSLGQFYVANLVVKLFPGKFWKNIIDVSLKEDKTNNQVFSIGAPSDAKGPPTLRVKRTNNFRRSTCIQSSCIGNRIYVINIRIFCIQIRIFSLYICIFCLQICIVRYYLCRFPLPAILHILRHDYLQP